MLKISYITKQMECYKNIAFKIIIIIIMKM